MLSKLKKKLRGDRSPNLSSTELIKEDALAQLMYYDTHFLTDDSYSMVVSRWNQARHALMGLAAHALKFDQDGIEISFLNHIDSGRTNEEEVWQLLCSIQPNNGTPTGRRLGQIFSAYITKIEAAKTKSRGADPSQSGIKPLDLIVITNGEPSDDPESVFVAAAH
ncbi:hypothetical protein RSOLAG22IIIB_11124 [Rhizoctonia solani]|uniref:Uncharacterized protein n=1 Tax=Rhizoctonia solani TaxID=456999 RepID=A0A0K6G6Q3_9AGAM|nr:hypothetical protein RSOLAG22IIIB_11124 [Rhizoctonia solani]